jgi:hypothetical protein
MADDVEELKTRMARLERLVLELSARIELLERFTHPKVENPNDQAAIRQKVTFDWQA